MAASAKQAADAAAAAVAAMEAAPYMRGTSGEVTLSAAIGVAATVSVPIVFDKPLPTKGYRVVVSFEGEDTGILGNLSAMTVSSSKDFTGCTVRVKNSALVSLGLNVKVIATALY
jgi:hypothetical protein